MTAVYVFPLMHYGKADLNIENEHIFIVVTGALMKKSAKQSFYSLSSPTVSYFFFSFFVHIGHEYLTCGGEHGSPRARR